MIAQGAPHPPDIALQPKGRDERAFRRGWLAGQASVGKPMRCKLPRQTVVRAAFLAARAYHREMGH
jgi:hypothetical protein